MEIHGSWCWGHIEKETKTYRGASFSRWLVTDGQHVTYGDPIAKPKNTSLRMRKTRKAWDRIHVDMLEIFCGASRGARGSPCRRWLPRFAWCSWWHWRTCNAKADQPRHRHRRYACSMRSVRAIYQCIDLNMIFAKCI